MSGRHRRRGLDRARHELTINARALAAWLSPPWHVAVVLFGVFAIL